MKNIEFPLEIKTKGMRRNNTVPWSLVEEPDTGIVIIGDTYERLPDAFNKVGIRRGTYYLFDSDRPSCIPVLGIAFMLERQGLNYDEIVEQARRYQEGFIALNRKARLYAAFCDNEYWPNNEKGGH